MLNFTRHGAHAHAHACALWGFPFCAFLPGPGLEAVRGAKAALGAARLAMARDFVDTRCGPCTQPGTADTAAGAAHGAAGAGAGLSSTRVVHHAEGHRASMTDVPPRVLAKIDRLTRVDLELFKTAVRPRHRSTIPGRLLHAHTTPTLSMF